MRGSAIHPSLVARSTGSFVNGPSVLRGNIRNRPKQERGALSRTAIGAALLLWPVPYVSAQDGGAIYKRSCAPCHEAGVDRAPTHEALHAMSPERVLAAMESGPMISMANRQSAAARRAIAEFITGKSLSHPMDTAPPAAAMCTAPAPAFGDPSSGPLWSGWGQNLLNTRFQSSAQAGLTP